MSTQLLSNEARALAYKTGIAALGPLVDRIIKLEHEVAALHEQIRKANAAVVGDGVASNGAGTTEAAA